jgi:hypothetical protein
MTRHTHGWLLIAPLAALGCELEPYQAQGQGGSTTASTSSSTGSGLQGGAGGAGGGDAGGGGSGGHPDIGECLPASTHEAVLGVAAAGLCVIAVYEAPIAVGTDASFFTAAPTWGSHGGPLVVKPGAGDSVDLTRLTPPSGASGDLAAATSNVDLVLEDTFFVGSQALDLPGSSAVIVSWTGAGSVGEVLVVDGSAVGERYPTDGFFLAAVRDVAAGPRLLHSGLTATDDSGATPVAALYGADFCAGPELCRDGAAAIDPWGLASGPVAVDADGHTFAIMTSPSFLGGDDTQTARAFHADTVAHGDGPIEGTELFVIDGFGSALAAIPAAGSSPGLLFFQPIDSTFVTEDVLAQAYVVDGNGVAPQGREGIGIDLVTEGAEVTLTSDDEGRLWVGVPTSADTSTFYVIARAP